MDTSSNQAISPLNFASNLWWLVLLRGIALLVLGILFFVNPPATILVVMTFVGAFWLVDGVFTFIGSISGRKHLSNWGWGVFIGVISTLAGIAVLTRPLYAALITQTFFVYLIAFYAIFYGISSIVSGIRLHKEIKGEWSLILGGVLALIFAGVILSHTVLSIVVLLYTLGVWAIIGGIMMIAASFSIKKGQTTIVAKTA